MAKDWGLEWRLVPAKARESCRWQSVDGAWVSLTLGHQKDITKIVVTASDGRVEVVEGYEEGLNLARRWRSGWVSLRSSSDIPASSSQPAIPSPGSGASGEGTGGRIPSSPRLSGLDPAEFPSRPPSVPPPRSPASNPGRPWSARRDSGPLPPLRDPEPDGSSWSSPSGLGQDSSTRSLPPGRLESLRQSSPPGGLPDPLSRSSPPAIRAPGARSSPPPVTQRPGPSSRPFSSPPPSRPLGTNPSIPPAEEFSGRSTHVPLPPLVPESQSGPYPVVERTDHGDRRSERDADTSPVRSRPVRR